MTLLADYQASTPTSKRARLSNIDDSAPSAPDTAFETIIATQAEGMFKTFVMVTYSSSDSQHESLGVKLMENIMKVRTQDDPDGVLEDRLNATISQLVMLGESLADEQADFSGG